MARFLWLECAAEKIDCAAPFAATHEYIIVCRLWSFSIVLLEGREGFHDITYRTVAAAPSIELHRAILLPYVRLRLYRLHRLRPIPLDLVRKRPTLILQLRIRPQLHASFTDHRNRILVHTPRVPVKQHLHALVHNLHRALPLQLLTRLLVRHRAPQDRLRQVRAEARRQRRRGESRPEQVGGGEERLVVLVEAADQHAIPQRVEV